MLTKLWNDDAGFIISAELVLVATILVIGCIVGLSEVQHAVVAELNDVGDAIGCLNQSYSFCGCSSHGCSGTRSGTTVKTHGSVFVDVSDDCDNNQCDIACDTPTPETHK